MPKDAEVPFGMTRSLDAAKRRASDSAALTRWSGLQQETALEAETAHAGSYHCPSSCGIPWCRALPLTGMVYVVPVPYLS